MNKAILVGRLTKDPEVRRSTNETVYTVFTLAINRRFQPQQADFINIITWNKTAEFCSTYFKKGMQVGIVGRIQTRTQDDPTTGMKRYITEVVGEEAYFVESKKSDGASTDQPMFAAEPKQEDVIDFQSFNGDEFKIEVEDDINFN